jgi:SAM-dependent methyltransferase
MTETSPSDASTAAARRGPHAPSCDHNKYPIHDVLKTIVTTFTEGDSGDGAGVTDKHCDAGRGSCRVLELGAGTAEHAIYFTEQFSPKEIAVWQATDLETELPGMKLNLADADIDPVRCPDPIALSFTDSDDFWSSLSRNNSWDIVFTANTFHIAPWEACLSCCAKLHHVLTPGGFFVIYGPFNYNGTYTSESNARFDVWLKKNKSAQSAIRHFEEVKKALDAGGLTLYADHAMPENNHCLVFRKLGKNSENKSP